MADGAAISRLLYLNYQLVSDPDPDPDPVGNPRILNIAVTGGFRVDY